MVHYRTKLLSFALLLLSIYLIPSNLQAQTGEPSQLQGFADWNVTPLFTIGESLNGYTPPGIPDGIGALKMEDGNIKFFINHELREGQGYAYNLANGTSLTGSRVSFFILDPSTMTIVDAGLAYDKIIDAAGVEVTSGMQIAEGNEATEGIRRLCSAAFFGAGEYGLEDDIFFTGEETGGGLEYALDVANNTLYAVPWMGRAAWENVTLMDSGDPSKIAILVGDDRGGAPLILYIGEKGGAGTGDFLDRNGLAKGKVYVWVADSGETTPEEWNGTGSSRGGSFVEIAHYDPAKAGTEGYDALGFVTQDKQDALAEAAGAFKFSRPEDVATNPADGTQAVMASTGRSSLFPADSWGTTYLIDVDFSVLTANIVAVYDGDDAGAGQFDDPDDGMRSPDNLDWADNGLIYLQEDRSVGGFGDVSGEETSIWELDPTSGMLTRIAQVDRTGVPSNQVDIDPDDLGDWETSGILDISSLLDAEDGRIVMIGGVQAHSLREGIIDSLNLVQGGQLFLLEGVSKQPIGEVNMLTGLSGFETDPIFTVGQSVGDYTPAGILDGIGAMEMDENTVRFFVNHELREGQGYAYELANGTSLTGARVSYFDVDKTTKEVIDAGLAYDKIIDAAGAEVTSGTQIAESNEATEGIRRLCSAAFFGAGEYGLEDDIFFTGEETGGGLEYALDVANNTLYAVPWMGRAAWENVTLMDSGDPSKIAILVGDDRAPAPLILYVGEKGAAGTGDFLDRNGLAKGKLYVWVAASGVTTPDEWNGTGNTMNGTFVEIDHYDAMKAGTDGYDALGFVTQDKQDELAEAAGAFLFSRPEDVATNPQDGSQAVMASTGRGQLYPADDFGTTYLVTVDFSALSASLRILYDGDDAGAGQFEDGDFGMRSPDNLDWADNGLIYIQEDRSTRLNRFGGLSGEEASIWQLDPRDGSLTRIGQVDRTAIPSGQTDIDPDDLGDWETSGILDVSELFDAPEGEILMIADVQAHSLRGGIIDMANLVQGGQLNFISGAVEPIEFTSEDICLPPTGVTTQATSPTSVFIDWQDAEGAYIYVVRYRPVGTTDWKYASVYKSRRTINRLLTGTTYEYQVQTLCLPRSDESGYGGTKTFTTPSSAVEARNFAESSFGTDFDGLDLQIAPNPVINTLTVNYRLGSESGVLSVLHISGQKVMQLRLTASSDRLELDLSDLPSGYYVITLNNGEEVLTKKLVKASR